MIYSLGSEVASTWNLDSSGVLEYWGGSYWGVSYSDFSSAKPTDWGNTDTLQSILVGCARIYDSRLQPPLRHQWWRMRGFAKFNTKIIGNFVASGYKIKNCVLSMRPSQVYADSPWDLNIYVYRSKNRILSRDAFNFNSPENFPNSILVSGYGRISSFDDRYWEINGFDYDDINAWCNYNLDWDYNAACQENLARAVSSSRFSEDEFTHVGLPLNYINQDGFTEMKFAHSGEMQDTVVPYGAFTQREYLGISTTQEGNLYLKFSMGGMRLLRNTDLSLISLLQNTFMETEFWPTISGNIRDNQPQSLDDLERPSIYVRHESTTGGHVQLGGMKKKYERAFSISLYACHNGELQDMTSIVLSGVKRGRVPIYDWNYGFGDTDPKVKIANLDILDYSVFYGDNSYDFDSEDRIRYTNEIYLNTETIAFDPDYDLFDVFIPCEGD
jgi:hypothetical protein